MNNIYARFSRKPKYENILIVSNITSIASLTIAYFYVYDEEERDLPEINHKRNLSQKTPTPIRYRGVMRRGNGWSVRSYIYWISRTEGLCHLIIWLLKFVCDLELKKLKIVSDSNNTTIRMYFLHEITPYKPLLRKCPHFPVF